MIAGFVVAAVLGLTLAFGAVGPKAALACSCPDCNVVRDADVIVGGRIER